MVHDIVEYEHPMSSNISTYTEDSIIIKGFAKQHVTSIFNPMELVDIAINFLELSKEKNWKLLDARGIEILREATIDDYIERLQKILTDAHSI